MSDIIYRGATISKSYYAEGYEWEHPDHVDASWNGDGWDTCGCGYGDTIEDCKADIDEMFLEIEEAEAA